MDIKKWNTEMKGIIEVYSMIEKLQYLWYAKQDSLQSAIKKVI